MAEIAIIAHQPLSEMDRMEISELMGWHQRLVETYNRINGAEEQ
ncbi:GpE family phage tail protein [Aeromonas salmonicida]|nr:GpE family phage tail protein [Aeromonas salmonicida]UUI60158.1 GpE family phage tail protein [Aeromonas salmonicida]